MLKSLSIILSPRSPRDPKKRRPKITTVQWVGVQVDQRVFVLVNPSRPANTQILPRYTLRQYGIARILEASGIATYLREMRVPMINYNAVMCPVSLAFTNLNEKFSDRADRCRMITNVAGILVQPSVLTERALMTTRTTMK